MKGHYTEVRFDATINKGNYESEKLGVTYSMAEGEDVFGVISEVKGVVYGTSQAPVRTEASITTTPIEKKTAAKKVKTDPALKEEKVEEPTKEVVNDSTQALAEGNNEETPADVKLEEEKVSKAETKEVKAPAKTKTPPTVIYDNKNDVHKARLAEFLDGWDKNWKAKGSEILKKCSAASAALAGDEPFLDADGKILDSFKKRFLELVTGK